MLRRALFFFMVTLLVPSFASAYNYWSISATTSPSTVPAGSIIAPTLPANTYSTSGTTTNVLVGTATTADFTVNAAPAGFVLSSVSIDGTSYTAPNNGTTYRVTKGVRTTHTLTATYAVKKYLITTSKTGNGVIDPTSLVAPGTSKTIKVTAAPGSTYTVTGVTVGELIDGDGVTYGAYQFVPVADRTIVATFVTVPVLKAIISNSSQVVAVGTPTLIDGSASTSPVPATFTWTATGGTIVKTTAPTASAIPGAPAIPAGQAAIFTATSAGPCTVTLKLSAANAADSSAYAAITATSKAIADSNVCLNCHTQKDPAVVAGYLASQHATSATANCTVCHTSTNFRNTTTNTIIKGRGCY